MHNIQTLLSERPILVRPADLLEIAKVCDYVRQHKPFDLPGSDYAVSTITSFGDFVIKSINENPETTRQSLLEMVVSDRTEPIEVTMPVCVLLEYLIALDVLEYPAAERMGEIAEKRWSNDEHDSRIDLHLEEF